MLRVTSSLQETVMLGFLNFNFRPLCAGQVLEMTCMSLVVYESTDEAPEGKVWPQHIQKDQLCKSGLPQEEVAQPLFA